MLHEAIRPFPTGSEDIALAAPSLSSRKTHQGSDEWYVSPLVDRNALEGKGRMREGEGWNFMEGVWREDWAQEGVGVEAESAAVSYVSSLAHLL